MLSSLIYAVIVAPALGPLANAIPLDKRSEAGPVMPENFPDPSIINVRGVWYAFATDGDNVNIQTAQSNDFVTWTFDQGADALPNIPAWVDAAAPGVWAPDVNALPDGSFVMYFAARTSQDATKHCVGAATSKTVKGPYTPLPSPLSCPLSEGGAIDPSGINDAGQLYVTYKIDGNSMGHGGPCGNTVDPIVSTPIMLQAVASDGVTPQGGSTQILDNNGAADQGIVEAPSLLRTAVGAHVLFFSSGCYSDTEYTVSYATADAIAGPYTRQGALFATGTNGLLSPGGADIDLDGQHLLFHAGSGNRTLYTATITVNGDKISA